MNITSFIRKSGFKILALARLTQIEYSIVLYLINCAASNLSDIITTELELASMLGFDEGDVTIALESLTAKNIIRLQYKDQNPETMPHPSLRIAFSLDTTSWRMDHKDEVTPEEAVVYPFYSIKRVADVEPGKLQSAPKENNESQTWLRILSTFIQDKSLDEKEIEDSERDAKILEETHGSDQVVLTLRHFGARIPSLSLLASSWEHYQEIYEQETSHINFMEARKKHHELDDELKKNAKSWLSRAHQIRLSASEINILKLLIRHRHPRRQLFWAYQARNNYVNLKDFFAENSSLMIGVTTKGTIIKATSSPKK